jgi:hypothetical protein
MKNKIIENLKTVADYNNNVLHSIDILTGKEFRRMKRQNKNYKNNL